MTKKQAKRFMSQFKQAKKEWNKFKRRYPEGAKLAVLKMLP